MDGNAPSSQRGIDFGPQVLANGLPDNFWAPNITEYDGSSDPTEHLWKFENCALLHQYTDGGVNEPLREYIRLFNTAAFEVPSANPEVLSNAFA
ncbi:hypothetical protein BUALT_Bualt05G0128000 [Buddleja alternifolia]|uniref:Uncharacterized protein n=1 Tax=Buddleja alternifolia TaxID=168488 RepID=A0AAV6XQH2_9LAMI|nr:hypothetical protein BUALT_Bualt05G0128000 [Buddleja alternifolia]